MDLKKLLSFNNKEKKIVVLGDSFFSDSIAYYLNKRSVKFIYIKLNYNYKKSEKKFFDNIYVNENLSSKLDLFHKSDDIKFTFWDGEHLIPIINNYSYFKECYINLTNYSDDLSVFDEFLEKKFVYNYNAKDYIKKNFTNLFGKIIFAILKFYNFPDIDRLKINDIQIILNDFFKKNLIFTRDNFAENFNIKTADINKIVVSEKDYLNVKNATVILKDRIITFDILFTDIPELLKDKKKILYEENYIEFKIKKDYTTEYFPKNLLFFYDTPVIMNLDNEDEEYRYFSVRNERKLSNIYIF